MGLLDTERAKRSGRAAKTSSFGSCNMSQHHSATLTESDSTFEFWFPPPRPSLILGAGALPMLPAQPGPGHGFAAAFRKFPC